VKHFKFRCSRIIFEEKKGVRLINDDEVHTHETVVTVYMEQVGELVGPSLHGFGYVNLTLSTEQFKELGFRVGHEYGLASMLTLDSVTS
jgi:hypothetical protein